MGGYDFLYDGEAVDRVRDLLNSGEDWNAAMVSQIAAIVRRTNRKVEKKEPPKKLDVVP